MSNSGVFLNQENIVKKVFDPATDALRVTGTVTTTAPAGGSTLAEQQTQSSSLQSIDSKLGVGAFQTSSLINTMTNPIPGSASLPLEVISSTSQQCYEIQVVEDIGEYYAIYKGAASAEVLLAAVPLGGGDIKVDVPAGTRLSVRSLKVTPINSNTNLIINLIG